MQLLVVAHVDGGTALHEVAGNPFGAPAAYPCALLDLEDHQSCAETDLNPCLEHGHGSQQEGQLLAMVRHRGDCLDGLSEPHVVALEPAEHLLITHNRSFLFLPQHPLDTILLMGEIGKTFPQGKERVQHNCLKKRYALGFNFF